MRLTVAALLAVAVAGGCDSETPERTRTPRDYGSAKSAPEPAAPPKPAPKPPRPPPPDPWAEALTSLATGKVESARRVATTWRRQAGDDPAFLRRLVDTFKDSSAAPEAREAAAFVLGSLQNKEGLAVLAEALAKASTVGSTKNLLLALGSGKYGDDDEVFAREDSPRVVRTPIGLSVEIRGRVVEAETRAPMIARIKPTEPAEVRAMAVMTLTESTDYPDVRQAFIAALGEETEPGALGEVARSLSAWAASQSPDAADRAAVVKALLEGGMRPEAALLRSKSEEGLRRMIWSNADVIKAIPVIEEGPLEIRKWVLSILSETAAKVETPSRLRILAAIEKMIPSASSPEMREVGITALGSFADLPRTLPLLVDTLEDSAWNVRAAAARTLTRMPYHEKVMAALKKVEAEDPDERVRQAASESLKVLSSR
jgi:HEAT repeat protein